MAIKLAKKNNVFNMLQRTFYIDDESDLETIEAEYDCGIGDIAECPDGTIYRRHSDGYDGELWVKKGSSGGGGGGSGLPDVTAADDGKTMVVQKVKTGDTVVLPEQTVTATSYDTPVTLSGANIERFVEGAILNVTLNDTEYTVEVISSEEGLAVFLEAANETIIGVPSDSSDMLLIAPQGEYTISITAPDYTSANWTVAPAGMVIHITNVGSQVYPDYRLDKTYSEIVSAIESGIVPIAIVQDTSVPTTYNLYPVTGYGSAYGLYKIVINESPTPEYSCASMDDFPGSSGTV